MAFLINLAQNGNYATSLTTTYFTASVSGTTLTVTPTSTPTSSAQTINVKEGNGGKTSSVTVTVVPASPTVTMATGSYTGTPYTSGSYLTEGPNVYHTITMPGSKEVSKYQYSIDDGTNWVDIPDTHTETEIVTETVSDSPKTMTFPLTDKPSWLGDVTKGDKTYEFTNSGTTLVSSQGTSNSGWAHSYIPINLSSYSSSDSLTITVNYSVTGSSTYSAAYASLTTSTTSVYNSSEGRFINNKYNQTNATASTTTTGGSIQYLHFWYNKKKTSGSYNMTINSITFESSTLLTKTVETTTETTTETTHDYTKTGNTAKFYIQAKESKTYKYRAVYSDNTVSQATDVSIRLIQADEVEYNPSDNGWDPGNVQNALDILYGIYK